MVSPDIIQIIIQGGAVGVLLAFGFGVYKVVRRLIEVGSAFATNHVVHLTDALDKNTAVLARLDESIKGCPARSVSPLGKSPKRAKMKDANG
jgi:hypothetical protein